MGGSSSALATDAPQPAGVAQQSSANDDSREVAVDIQPPSEMSKANNHGELIVTDMSSKLVISMRCEELPKACPTFVMVYSKRTDEHDLWHEEGRTELQDPGNKNPVYNRDLVVDFSVQVRRLMRFEVYKVRDELCLDDLECQKLIGSTECLLVDIVMARGRPGGNGWLTRDLQTLRLHEDGRSHGRIAIFAEEDLGSKYAVSFSMLGRGLKSTDAWKLRGADLYCIINRTLTIPCPTGEDELRCTPVYRTEVKRHSNKPTFKRMEFLSSQLCQNDDEQAIVIEIFDWFRVSRDRYVGECMLTLAELRKASLSQRPVDFPVCVRQGKRIMCRNRQPQTSSKPSDDPSARSTKESSARYSSKLSGMSSFSLSKFASSKDTVESLMLDSKSRKTTKDSQGTAGSSKSKGSSTRSDNSTEAKKRRWPSVFGKVVGQLRICDIQLQRHFSFLDYIRGGLGLQLVVAIDFTRSNRSQQNQSSLHCLSSDRPSAYATAIRAVGNVLQSYDSDGKFSVYGFGAKIPPTHTVLSNCFSLTGDIFDPEVEGVDGIIRAYQRALHVVHFHGPTQVAEVIRHTAGMARPAMKLGDDGKQEIMMNYYVLLILTDGTIDDELHTFREVLSAAALPISIIFVGIGDHDFRFLRELAASVRSTKQVHDNTHSSADKQERSVMHFVPYADYRDKPAELASTALSALPGDICGYFADCKMKPQGLDKMEDNNGNPIGKIVPTSSDGRKESASKLSAKPESDLSVAHSRRGTNKSGVSVASTRTGGGDNGMPKTAKQLEAAAKKRLDELPPFVREERERLIEEATSLGYENTAISRALRDGIPAATVASLVDNIVHAGYGKGPTYTEAANKALPDMEATLPGQPTPEWAGIQPHSRNKVASTDSDMMLSMLSGSRGNTKELQDAGFDRRISTSSFDRVISTRSFDRAPSTSSFDRVISASSSPDPSQPDLSPHGRSSRSSRSPPRVSKEVAKGTWDDAFNGSIARQHNSKELSRVSLGVETAGGETKEPSRRISKGILVAGSSGVRQLTKEKRKISFDNATRPMQDSIADGPLRVAGRAGTLETEPPAFGAHS